jgi:hypothetical protein
MYIIKTTRNDDNEGRRKIFEEYQKTRFIHYIHPKTTQALFVEQNYLVEKRIRSESLSEIAQECTIDELTNELYCCFDTLIDISNKVRPKRVSQDKFEVKYYDEFYDEIFAITIPKYNFIEEIKRRLTSRYNIDSTLLIKEYQKSFSNILFEEKFIHSDAYKENWMHNGVLIDWERPHIGDPLIDIIQLINDSKFEVIKNKVLSYYTIHSNIKEKISEKYNFISIHNALCQIGSKLNQNKKEEAQAYMTQAVNLSTGKLKNAIIDYLSKIK